MSRFTRALLTLVVLLLVPHVQAEPLPIPEDPVPDPEEPQNGTDPLEDVRKLMNKVFPEDAPFEGECFETDSGTYGRDEDPGRPITTGDDPDSIVVRIWHDGQWHSVKIKTSCVRL